MSLFDVILIVLLAAFVLYGFMRGFIRMVGSLIGVIAGAWLAGHYYLLAFDLLHKIFGQYENLGKVASFLIVFAIVQRLISLVFWILDKIFHIFSFIPFSRLFNKMLGVALGMIEGGLVLGLALYVISKYTFISSIFGAALTNLEVAPWLITLAKILLPLLPDLLKSLASLI